MPERRDAGRDPSGASYRTRLFDKLLQDLVRLRADDAIPVGKKNTTQAELYKEIDAALEKKPAKSADE